ncbi:MAG: immune inhibitor A [Chloroflexi bacterium]|nr:immune inhibitor A [Chloroflexota bacterium]
MNRRTLLALIAVLVVLVCLVLSATAALLFSKNGSVLPLSLGVSPTPAAAPIATLLPLEETPLPAVPDQTALALQQAVIPERDLYQIVPRLRKDLALLTPPPTPVAQERHVGDVDSFYVVQNATTGTYRSITATLQVVTPHSYYWVESGITLDQAALQKAADFFENTIYPTNHKYFGSERSPGPDGDVHINILNTRFQDAAGYFSTEDTYPRSLVPYSNQRNIIYLNVDALHPDNDQYSADTAHEFQHLIHSYEAQHKTGWIDEGMGDLAIKLNGFPVLGVLDTFGRAPDTQLDTWAVDPRASAAHYAASYLFFDYGAERFGPQFTRDVIHAPSEGINGIQSVLDATEGGIKFDDLFADWTVANYLNDPSVSNGRYAYPNESTFHISREPVLGQFPVSRTAQMNEYAANYYTLQPAGGDVTLYFTGTTTARLLPVGAHSGQWDWYSNRADLADMTLTRPFDLSGVDKATLSYWTWYDIEQGFDYAYVEASTDGGKTWDILAGNHSSTVNPNGASYGPAYTGVSASSDQAPAQWIQDQVDLTPYARKKILVRFEYITDDAFNRPSWALDDITIPEINFSDNVENGTNGWDAQGFVRSDNVLPQHFTVQVVEKGSATRVVPVPLDDQNRGSFTIAGFGSSVTGAELVIASGAPTTTEPTRYDFSLVPK